MSGRQGALPPLGMVIPPQEQSALQAYVEFRKSAEDLKDRFSAEALHDLDPLIDALEEELLSRLRPATMEDVRRLPPVLHKAAVGALIDQAEARLGRDPRSLDWHRVQIIGHPENLKRLVQDSSVITPADVLRWMDERAENPNG